MSDYARSLMAPEIADKRQNEEFAGQFSPRAILVFGRAPRVGKVKTRLAATIGNAPAAHLYAAMLRDSLELASGFQNTISGNEKQRCEVTLAFTPPSAYDQMQSNDDEEIPTLFDLWTGARMVQSEGDLGRKMLDALARMRESGARQIVLIGSDAPDLPPQIIARAFERLREVDLVFSPASDGGFVLIAASRALPATLFDGVDWSVSQTLAPCLECAARFDLSAEMVEEWHDVDTSDDLQALKRRLSDSNHDIAPATRDWIARHPQFFSDA